MVNQEYRKIIFWLLARVETFVFYLITLLLSLRCTLGCIEYGFFTFLGITTLP
jgi:hypothetical protein